MSKATPTLVTRTTRRELVVICFVETISEVYEVPAADSVFPELTARPIVKASAAPALRLVVSR